MTYKTLFDGKRDKKIIPKFGGSDAILSRMFEDIIFRTNISLMKWNDLMTAYIKDPRNSIPANNKEQSSERGNVQKELFKGKMTWKVFCKGMRILNCTKFELSFKIFHVGGKISIHSTMVNLGSFPDDNDEKESDIIEQLEDKT